jgi:hypothetical protein
MKQYWSLTFFAVGLFLLLGGFIFDVLFAGFPYQDPTPEMSANYVRHSRIACAILWSGVAAVLLGVFVSYSRWLVRRQKKYQNEKPIS